MDGFIGEIRPFAFTFAPDGWIECNGASLPVQQYTALYSIIGTIYGGDGRSSFNVPNLQGVVANGQGQLKGGSNYPFGGHAGTEAVTLSSIQLPGHTHTFNGAVTPTTAAAVTQKVPSPTSYISNLFVTSTTPASVGRSYQQMAQGTQFVQLNPMTITPVGGGGAHENRAPFLPIIYCICWQGEFPPRP